MFEARLLEGSVFKQIIDSVKDFVTDANVNAAEEALRIQCMDSSHVALVDVQLQVEAFDHYRCDKPLCLGIKPPNIAKILKLMNRDDIIVLKAEEGGDVLTMMFESNKDSKTIADFGTCPENEHKQEKMDWRGRRGAPRRAVPRPLTPLLFFLSLCAGRDQAHGH
jgi:proliferating cell nuclear antigen